MQFTDRLISAPVVGFTYPALLGFSAMADNFPVAVALLLLGSFQAGLAIWKASLPTTSKSDTNITKGLMFLFVAVAFLVVFRSSYTQKQQNDRIEQEITASQKFRKNEEARQRREEEQKRLMSNPGELTPRDPQQKIDHCGRNSTSVALGSFITSATKFPFVPIEVNGKPFLTLDRSASGNLSVTFDVHDERGNLLARVDDGNTIFIPPLHSYLIPRRDLHSVGVGDERGNVILNIEYANRSEIKITGKFVQDGYHIEISESGLFVRELYTWLPAEKSGNAVTRPWFANWSRYLRERLQLQA